jgi:MerR family transcriptional regulator, repressor of the yfmOP operon
VRTQQARAARLEASDVMSPAGHQRGAATATSATPAAAPGHPRAAGELLGIGAAAARAGVSERALRYYQQIGLLKPACTPGGLRRYSEDDLARVARIRELQTLLGLNLDEIALVLRNEDRIAQIRTSYQDARTSDDERRQLIREGIALQEGLLATVRSKRAALDAFLADLDARIETARGLLAGTDPLPAPGASAIKPPTET